MTPARRQRGEGSIYKRADGQWTGSLNLGTGHDGKRRRKVIYGATQRDVVRKLNAARREWERTGQVAAAHLTLGASRRSLLCNTPQMHLHRASRTGNAQGCGE